MTTQSNSQSVAQRALTAIGMLFAGSAGLFLIAGFLYGVWNFNVWQYEWGTGCMPDHGGIYKTEWLLGIRPLHDCRPWWARRLFDP